MAPSAEYRSGFAGFCKRHVTLLLIICPCIILVPILIFAIAYAYGNHIPNVNGPDASVSNQDIRHEESYLGIYPSQVSRTTLISTNVFTAPHISTTVTSSTKVFASSPVIPVANSVVSDIPNPTEYTDLQPALTPDKRNWRDWAPTELSVWARGEPTHTRMSAEATSPANFKLAEADTTSKSSLATVAPLVIGVYTTSSANTIAPGGFLMVLGTLFAVLIT